MMFSESTNRIYCSVEWCLCISRLSLMPTSTFLPTSTRLSCLICQLSSVLLMSYSAAQGPGQILHLNMATFIFHTLIQSVYLVLIITFMEQYVLGYQNSALLNTVY